MPGYGGIGRAVAVWRQRRMIRRAAVAGSGVVGWLRRWRTPGPGCWAWCRCAAGVDADGGLADGALDGAVEWRAGAGRGWPAGRESRPVAGAVPLVRLAWCWA